MTHVEFITEVAKRLEWPEENTTGIIETILDIISAELKVNNPVLIEGFGSLKTGVEPEYIMVDPETKDRYLMPPAIEVIFEAFFREKEGNPFLQAVFMPDETLYNDLNLSFSQFEPTLLNEGVQFPGIPEIIVEEPKEEIETTEYALSQEVESGVPVQPYLPEEESGTTEYPHLQEVESKSAGQPHLQEEETAEYPQKEDNISLEHSARSDDKVVREIEKPMGETSEETVQVEAVPMGEVPVTLTGSAEQAEDTESSVQVGHTIQTGLAEETVSAVQTEPSEQTELSGRIEPSGRTVPDSVTKSPPRYRSASRRQKSKKTSAVWIPIAGDSYYCGIAFFSRERGTGKAEMTTGEIVVAASSDTDPSASSGEDFVTSPDANATHLSQTEPHIAPAGNDPHSISLGSEAKIAPAGRDTEIPSAGNVPEIVPSGKRTEKVVLPEGKTLRLLALELFGNREFWVYIYLENKDKIPNPNQVASGLELFLPDKSAYSLNAADPHSVAKAKSLGDEVLVRY